MSIINIVKMAKKRDIMRSKVIREFVSIFVVMIFLFTNTIYAAPSPRSLFKNKTVDHQKLSAQQEERIQQKKSVFQGEDASLQQDRNKEAKRVLQTHLKDISQIHIPSEFGRVTEVYQAPSNEQGLIVHIQDLHTNPEAQYNLANILEFLLKDYKLGLVCSEGADGIVDTSRVSSFPDYQSREKVGRIFVDSGELTGEEYLSITKYPDLPIWGIEDRDIYFENIIQFNKIMKFNPASETFISQAKKALEELKPRIYSDGLARLDQKETEYESEKIQTEEYLNYLTGHLRKFSIPTKDYKNISLLREAIEQEKAIDQAKIMQDSQNLLLNLQAAISQKSLRSEMDSLAAKSHLFREQKISPFSFYSYLRDLALKHLSDNGMSRYSNLNGFIEYLTKVNSLDTTRLFVEMEALTFDVKQRLAKTEEEKGLTQTLRNIKFLEGFFNLKVSNEELDYYLNNKEIHKVAFFESFLKPALKKYRISSFIDFNPGLIDDYLQELEDFYQTVKGRDIAMIRNSLSEIARRNIKVAALISGGFHTKGITGLLRDKGYSYVVISPYSSTDIDEENYRTLLSGKRKPIEELLKQLNAGEVIDKLSSTLRVTLGCDLDLTKAYNEEIAPLIAKLFGIPEENAMVKELMPRIVTALSLQRGAERWDLDEYDIVILASESNRETVFLKSPAGNFKITKTDSGVIITEIEETKVPDGNIILTLGPGSATIATDTKTVARQSTAIKKQEPFKLSFEPSESYFEPRRKTLDLSPEELRSAITDAFYNTPLLTDTLRDCLKRPGFNRDDILNVNVKFLDAEIVLSRVYLVTVMHRYRTSKFILDLDVGKYSRIDGDVFTSYKVIDNLKRAFDADPRFVIQSFAKGKGRVKDIEIAMTTKEYLPQDWDNAYMVELTRKEGDRRIRSLNLSWQIKDDIDLFMKEVVKILVIYYLKLDHTAIKLMFNHGDFMLNHPSIRDCKRLAVGDDDYITPFLDERYRELKWTEDAKAKIVSILKLQPMQVEEFISYLLNFREPIGIYHGEEGNIFSESVVLKGIEEGLYDVYGRGADGDREVGKWKILYDTVRNGEKGQAKGRGVMHRGIDSINEAIRIAYDASTSGKDPEAFLTIQENGTPVDGIKREHAIILPVTLKAIDSVDGRSLNGIVRRLEKNLSRILEHEVKLGVDKNRIKNTIHSASTVLIKDPNDPHNPIIIARSLHEYNAGHNSPKRNALYLPRRLIDSMIKEGEMDSVAANEGHEGFELAVALALGGDFNKRNIALLEAIDNAAEELEVLIAGKSLLGLNSRLDDQILASIAHTTRGAQKLTFTNVLSQKVTPEQGLTEEDLAEAKDELEVIHTSIQRDIASSQLNELYKTPSSRIEREKEIERMAGLAEDWKDRYDDILIIGGEESGAHMAFRALTEEKWNELSKSERKNFPKIHFVNIGNVAEIADAINLEKTGIVVIGNSISQSNLGAFRLLEKGYSTKGVPIIPRVSIVGTLDGTLFPALGRQAIPLENQFSIPEGLEDMDSFFSAAGLLPLILAGKIKEAENILAGADSAAEAISDIDLSTPATGIPAIFRHPEYMHPGIIAKLYEKKGKNICIYSPFSEKLRLFGVWASDQFNSIVGRKKDNRLVFQGAVGTRHNHASLQSWQKGHNMFQVVTLGVDEFRSVLAAGRSSYNLFRDMPFADLMNFSMEGTEQALAEGKRPNVGYRVKKVDGVSLGGLIYTTLYQKLVLSRLMDTGEKTEIASTSLGKKIKNILTEKPISEREEGPGVIRDASGLSLDYSGVFGEDQITDEEFPEVLADLVNIQMEVARERLAGKHDYLNLPERMIQEVQSDDFKGIISDFRNFKDVLVIGIGGSSVGAKMCLEALSVHGDRKTPNIHFLENVDPDYIEEILKGINLSKTGVIVISKSGETMESNTIFATVKEMMQEAFSEAGHPHDYRSNILAITDPDFGILKKEARREGYRTLDVPPLVDGRFSVLSGVGLAVIGLKLTDTELLGLLEGARDYVNATELDLNEVKEVIKLEKNKKRSKSEETELKRLEQELQEESEKRVSQSIGYMYGGLRSQLNHKKQKDLSAIVTFSYKLTEALDWLIQLYNESLGKPGVKEYTTGVSGLDLEGLGKTAIFDNNGEVVTLIDIKDTGQTDLDAVRTAYHRSSDSLLRKNKQPVFSWTLPSLGAQSARSFGAFIVAWEQAIMVQSKSGLFTKQIDYSGQPGVENAKRFARKAIEQRKELAGVDVIPHELSGLGSAIGSLSVAIGDIVSYEDVEPQEREQLITTLIMDALNQKKGDASIRGVWIKGTEQPELINREGRYTILVNPLDASSNIEINNGTVTTSFAVYDGGQFIKENLIATFVIIYGPATGLVARVKTGDEFFVYDFILDEKTKSFVQRQRGGRETSLIEMGYKGEELAIWGKVKDWPSALKDFYYKEIYRSGKKVRISESAADLYEMLLKGGIIAAPMTECDAVMWGSIIESAGGRSLVMTEDGPISCTDLKLGKDSFSPDKQIWAYFGNRDVMERMEQSLKGPEDLDRDKRREFYKSNIIIRGPPKSIDTSKEDADGKELEAVLREDIGDDDEIVGLVAHAANVAAEIVKPMFSVIGVEEGLGEINVGGDEQVGGDTFTNRTFRNRLLNPKNDIELERRLNAAEERGARLEAKDFDGVSLVSAFYSEEEDLRYPGNNKAKYMVSFDPLDGSSKVDTLGGVSSILTIWDKGESNDIIGKTGHRDVRGVCFVLYGPQTRLVYASAKSDKVFEFRLNRDGKWERVRGLRPLPQISQKGLRLAIGGERPDMVPKGSSENDDLDSLITALETRYGGKAGYSGSMNIDIAGILFALDPEADGGMYAYPGTARRPEGRLRLDSELIAMSFMMEKLGGKGTNGTQNILDMPVEKLHQKEPFFVGTKDVIDRVEGVFGRKDSDKVAPEQKIKSLGAAAADFTGKASVPLTQEQKIGSLTKTDFNRMYTTDEAKMSHVIVVIGEDVLRDVESFWGVYNGLSNSKFRVVIIAKDMEEKAELEKNGFIDNDVVDIAVLRDLKGVSTIEEMRAKISLTMKTKDIEVDLGPFIGCKLSDLDKKLNKQIFKFV